MFAPRVVRKSLMFVQGGLSVFIPACFHVISTFAFNKCFNRLLHSTAKPKFEFTRGTAPSGVASLKYFPL